MERTESSFVAGGWVLLSLGALALAAGCWSAEDRYEKYASDRVRPVVETEPSPLRSCTPKPRPRAEVVAVAGAPLAVRLVRAYHLCLGTHVALLRLGRARHPILQVVLDQERYDVRGRRAPRRSSIAITRRFDPATVRYHRIRWREGRAHPDERGLRVRLAAVDFANGTRWTAPAWAPSPPVLPRARPVPGPLAPLDKIHDALLGVTRALRKARLKLQSTTRRNARPRPHGSKP